MSALDPVVSARPAYLPTGPRGDYQPEHCPYRRGEEARGDDVSRNEPSTSQEAFTMQPTTATLGNALTHLPLAVPAAGDGQSPQDFVEERDERDATAIIFADGSQKDRVLTAVAHGARTTTEITLRTGLLREQVHKTVCWLVKRGELRDLPNDEERTVECARPGNHEPSLRKADDPQTSPAPTLRAQDSTPAADDLINQMEATATEALTALRDAISRLAGLARENAQARDRLAAVQKLLVGEQGRRKLDN